MPWYDPDILIDGTERFMASEVIRGRVLALLRDEVPHCVAVEIDEYKSPEEYPDRKRLYIRAALIVETEGQKAILIGQVVRTIAAPISGLVNVLSGTMRGLVTCLAQIRDKKDAA